MHATLIPSELAKGLNIVNRALSNRNQLPILANVLIQVEKTGVTLSTTNLEVGLRTQVGGKVEETGEITIPARNLAEFTSTIGGNTITLTSDTGKLKVNGGKFQATFAGIDAAEFPVLPKLSSQSLPGIPSSTVGQIATQVAYAAATDESRPVLTGIRFQSIENNLVVVATDGFRLSRKQIPLQSHFSALGSNLILPAKTWQEVARLAADSGEEEVKMELVAKNNQVIFKVGNTDLISRILEGNYPDTDKIIPNEFPTEVIIDRQEFIQGLKAASIFAREDNNIIRIKVYDSRINISARAAQQGESEVEIEAENRGEGEIAFNYKYVIEVLNSLPEERVKLQMKDNTSPGVFRLEKDTSLLALVMPVRI